MAGKSFLPLVTVVALAFAGCDAPRQMTPAESVQQFTIEHQMTKREAYDASELWIAENFVKAQAVIDLRQPDNGLLIGKSSHSGMVWKEANFLEPERRFRDIDYTAKIQNADHQTVLTIRIDAITMAPEVIADALQKNRALASEIATALHGRVTSQPALATDQRNKAAAGAPAPTKRAPMQLGK